MQFLIPDQFHRLCVARLAPPASVARHAAEMGAFLGALSNLHPSLYAFFGYPTPLSLVRCDPTRDLPRLLEQSRIAWAAPGVRDPTHALCLINKEEGASYADLCTSFVLEGEEPRVSPGVVVEMRLGRFVEAAPDRSPADALRVVFDALVRAFRPDFGFIETAGTADPAPTRPDHPVVRWLTYLSREQPPASDLTAPNVAYYIDDLGTAYLATAELASAANVSQKQALAQLEVALRPDASARPVEPPRSAPDPPRPAVVPSAPSYMSRLFPGTQAAPPPPPPGSHPEPAPPRAATFTPDAVKAALGANQPLPFAARTRARAQGIVDEETADSAPFAPAQTLPIAGPPSVPAPAPQPPAGMTLEQYASLCAEIASSPAKTAEIAARYRIPDEGTWDALHEAWQTWLARDFATWQRWRALVAEYRTWLHDRGAG
jgi:hypothetical protein